MATSDDSGLYIGTSTTTDPEDTDAPSKGAAEIRQVKIQAKNTFPNCTGAVTSSHTELNYLDGSTPGTAVASKALVVDANKDIDLGTGDLTATLLTGAHNGTVGATTPAAGTFTTLTANTSITMVNAITEFSTDGTLAGDSDTAVPTEKAVKTYVDALSVGPTSGTAVEPSGTAIAEFTGIPSGVSRITMGFSDLSLSGTSYIRIQLGDADGYETASYTGGRGYFNDGNGGLGNTDITVATDSFEISTSSVSARTYHGTIVFQLIKAATNTWAISGGMYESSNPLMVFMAGHKSLSSTLTQLKVFSGVNFSSGIVNILYE